MTWASYGSFTAFAAVIVVAPGPDVALLVRNTLARGRGAGVFTSLGVVLSCVVQGTAAALGLGVLITSSHGVFLGIRWAGIAYLCYLGIQALIGAIRRGDREMPLDTLAPPRPHRGAALRQGFLCNITNPKVLAFYLSVLPQFLGHAGTPTVDALVLAYTHALLGVIWLLGLVAFLHRVNPWLRRRRVRRTIDGVSGVALLGFASILALESR